MMDVLNLGLPPLSGKYADALVAYVAYFGSRYVGNDIQVLCGNIFDHPLVKTFTLFCIMYQAAKDVKIALAMTVVFLVFQFILSRTKKCAPYADKTNARIDTKPYFWPKNADLQNTDDGDSSPSTAQNAMALSGI